MESKREVRGEGKMSFESIESWTVILVFFSVLLYARPCLVSSAWGRHREEDLGFVGLGFELGFAFMIS